MSNQYSHFLSNLQIRGKVWKNRSVAAPMGGIETENGQLKDEIVQTVRFYGQGSPAEYIVGETPVNVEGFRGPAPMAFHFDDEANRPAIQKYADLIHEETGALAMIELCHCGDSKTPNTGSRIVGPSSYIREDGEEVHGLSEEEILAIIKDFADAAQVCSQCGFDGVVIHGGHGWIHHQFLSERTNKREDRFGGSLENRARFLIMTLDAVRAACGEDFIIECRMSGAEHVADGYSKEDFCEIAKELEGHCDIIHVSAGLYRSPVETGMVSSIYDPHGLNVEIAQAVKQNVKTYVSVVGGINDPAMCEEIIAQGKADLIVMGRERLAEPHFVEKCQQDKGDQIRGCLRCMRCFPGPFESVLAEMQTQGGPPVPPKELLEQIHSCSINPEYENGIRVHQVSEEEKKKVLVVGGGCAGMEAALTASRCGHEVTLLEKKDRLGGILNFAAEDQDKRDLYKLARSMSCELRDSTVQIYTRTEYTLGALHRVKPDVVIAAIGSEPSLPPIPGLKADHVLQAMEAYHAGQKFADTVIVLGGGTVGCETAVHIAQKGSRVILVEMAEKLCPDAYRLHGIRLREKLQELGVEIHLQSKCLEVLSDGVLISTAEGEEKLEGSQVINALGMKSNSCDEIRTDCENENILYYEIGDCKKARNIYAAITEGYLLATGLA